jgi:diguanylate cyclase (GGDEF)-like protein
VAESGLPTADGHNRTARPAVVLTSPMPVDTSAVLLRMLSMADEARLQQHESLERPLIPRPLIAMILRVMRALHPSSLLHSQRLAVISSGVARMLGWSDEQRRQIEIAAILHDIGKLAIPDHILRKPGKLSSEEFDFVILHQQAAISMLQAFWTDPSVISMLTLLYRNLAGAPADNADDHQVELPLGPRILAVADAYDSLCTTRPWRRGMTHRECIDSLLEKSGLRYDENVIRTLSHWYDAEGNSLFRFADSMFERERRTDLTPELREEAANLAQIIGVLYQFQHLYDGYYLVDAYENYRIWSDGMRGMTGIPVQSALKRTWQAPDVQLTSLAEEQAAPPERDDTMVLQALHSGRPQYASQFCRVSGTKHLKVDVYTMPLVGTGQKIRGVIQFLRNHSGVRIQSREFVELQLAATRDALTGVANRGHLEARLRDLIEEYHNCEGTRNLSVIFLDVDHFKRINDTFGHQVGDQVLIDLARLLQNETYSAEVIGRYGGEEFVIICPDTDLESAVRRAERLRLSIMKSSIGGTTSLNVTSSLGVGSARRGDSVQSLIERADACLYEAKSAGRNRTCHETAPEVTPPVEETPPEEATQVREKDGLYEFSDRIEVSTSLELTGIKLRAFISEQGGSIAEQEKGRMKIQIGSPGFFNRWGRTPAKQPVELIISFETTRRSSSNWEPARIHRIVSVEIRSQAKVPNLDVFTVRCLGLMRDLRAYLLGA